MKEVEIIKYLLPYLNIQESTLLPGLKINEDAQALIYGLSIDELKAKYDEYAANAKGAAFELLKSEEFNQQLNRIPFRDEDKIVVIGDNSADEKGGWAQILQDVYNFGTDNEIKVVNRAASGKTSTEILKDLGQTVLAEEPDWVIVSMGTWDAFRPNYASDRPLVSLTDFWENINSITVAIKSLETRNPIIWLSPSLVVESIANDYPFFNGTLSNAEIRAYQEVIRDKDGIIIDPYFTRFGEELAAWQFANDGVHFSTTGNIETVKTLVETLSRFENKKGS
ncbi:SGNH/GDSL hydrolase family protein [bacterium]|nr:MAG: SGNH/GDSL hydrolase family protein [bacterium]